MKRTPGFVAAVAEARRRWWPVWVIGVAALVAAVLFAAYLNGHQRATDDRLEKFRAGICGALANIPGDVPPYLAKLRVELARPGHPRDCQPITHPAPRPRPTPTVTRTAAAPAPTVILVTPISPVRPTPAPSRSSSSPRPSPTPSHRPSPTPSPTPTCLRVGPVCV